MVPSLAVIGRVVGIWFFAWLIGLGALYPGYSHLTKAVSELGAFGAPTAFWMNLFGFSITGILISLFGIGLRDLLARCQIQSTGGWAVIALFSGTAISADFELRLESPWTVSHAVFVLLGPIMFLWAAIVWPTALRKLQVNSKSRYMCHFAGWLLLPAFLSNFFLEQIPGLGQTFGFVVIFVWCFVISNAVSHTKLQKFSD